MNFSRLLEGASMRQLPPAFTGETLVDPLSVLPVGLTFKTAKNVEDLHLSNRGLTAIPPDAFASTPFTVSLWLSDNRLRTLSNLRGLSRLKRLFCARNAVHSLSPSDGCELVDTAAFLEELDLTGNPLANLDAILDELSRMPFLKSLSLVGTPASQEADYRARVLARVSKTLTTLDFRVVTEAERAAASSAYGDTASSAVRASARVASETSRAATDSLRSSQKLRTTKSFHIPERSDGAHDFSNETGRVGLGRSASRGPAQIHFGEGFGRVTSTRDALNKEAVRVRERTAADARAAVDAQFGATAIAEQGRAGLWHETIDHSDPAIGGSGVSAATTHKSATADEPVSSVLSAPAEAPAVTTSALINLTQAAAAEDIFPRRLRDEMLARGIQPATLIAGSSARDEAIAGRDRQAAFLVSLTPALPSLTGTAPLLPPRKSEDSSHPSVLSGDAKRPGVRSNAFTLGATAALQKTYPELSRTLSAAAETTGLAATTAHSPLALERTMLSKARVRLSLKRPSAENMTRAGLTRTGEVDSSAAARAAVDEILGRGVAPDGGPLLPALTPAGQLGAWDTFRLLTIFKGADTDGSGELSIDEIRACLTEAADFGFCVVSDEFVPPVVAPAPGETTSISRVGTPAGGAASTAFLGTTSSNGRAPLLGASRRINSLLEKIFAAVDADGSGTVSWREFAEALEGKASKAGGAASSAGAAVPRMRFRPLNAEECSARAQRHFRTAEEAHAELVRTLALPLPAAASDVTETPAARAAAVERHSAFVNETAARLRNSAMIAAVRGARLMAMAKALAGVYDPPREPPPPPPPRSDFFPQKVLANAAEVAAVARSPRRTVPLPGDEFDSDDRALLRTLHPSALELEEEAEDEEAGGTMAADRKALAASLIKSLKSDEWARNRARTKGKAEQAIWTTRVNIAT